MSALCSKPVAWEDLVAYWAGDLPAEHTDRLDEHLMGCAACSVSSGRVAAITEAFRAMIPAFVSPAVLEALRAKGVRIVENRALPGERRTAVFPIGVDVLLHRLAGIDLVRAESVEVTVTAEETSQLLMTHPGVPFDPDSGEILVACQRHFGENSVTILFEVCAREASGEIHVSRFAIPHEFM
jgi:hypothetical protein